jgi:hypothetical protein
MPAAYKERQLIAKRLPPRKKVIARYQGCTVIMRAMLSNSFGKPAALNLFAACALCSA